ncbi:MAG: hypothetical protein ABJX32_15390 [Tateyamaria sp.]|uniref:hypothetical protein n=1 Tax=Tateyamaria sp. TaxID=1929288 RepID=UPI00329AA2F9
MTRVYVVDKDGTELEAHYYHQNSTTKPDMFGMVEGYRCAPSGKNSNWSKNGLFYRSIDDLADHLRNNKDWGLRVTKAPSQSLRFNGIHIDGVKL